MTTDATRPLTHGEVIDRLARIMRDSLDPSFKDAPPPAWAEAAAAEIIAYHQPMLRDTILDAHLEREPARYAALVEAARAVVDWRYGSATFSWTVQPGITDRIDALRAALDREEQE